MLLRLLRFFARRPLTLLALVAASLLATIAVIGLAVSGPSGAKPGSADPGGASADRALFAEPADPQPTPRAILNRGWYDRYPRKRTDEVKFLLFFGSGFGVYEEGSAYRISIDVFEFERQNDKVWMKFFHDGKTAESRFSITRCDEKSPFDLCLDIPDTPRGPKRFYGFDWYDDYASRIPWGPQIVRAAEEHTRVR